MLREQDVLAHTMHADAPECIGDGRQRADHIVFARAPHLVQRPRRVLAARPRDQSLGLAHRRRVPLGALPQSRSAASAARSPDSQAPPTVPHSVSCTASPAKKRRSRTGSISALRPGCPPGAAAENAPSVKASRLHAVAAVLPTAFFTSAP